MHKVKQGILTEEQWPSGVLKCSGTVEQWNSGTVA